MKSYSLPEDVKQQMREMAEDGLRVESIWKYFNRDCFPISKATITQLLYPEKRKASAKKYLEKNKKRIYKHNIAYSKKRYREDPEYQQRQKEYSAQYFQKHKEAITKKQTAYVRKRYQEDPAYRERRKAAWRRWYDKKKAEGKKAGKTKRV